MKRLSELRRAVEMARELTQDGDWVPEYYHSIQLLIALAESHLSPGVEGVEKKEHETYCRFGDGNNSPCYCGALYWNQCLDAVRLAGWRRVPSVEEIATMIEDVRCHSELWNAPTSLAIKQATAIHELMVEKMEGEKQ